MSIKALFKTAVRHRQAPVRRFRHTADRLMIGVLKLLWLSMFALVLYLCVKRKSCLQFD